jgi:hypothetical protein
MTQKFLVAELRRLDTDTSKETLNKYGLSFPRKREPSQINKLDSRFRGNEDLFSISLNACFG